MCVRCFTGDAIKIICTALVLSFVGCQECTMTNNENALIDHLFKNYNPAGRPLHDPRQAVSVMAELKLVSIEELNERDQTLRSYTWLNLEWTDEFLKWDPDDWCGITKLMIPAPMLWSPDLVIRNSVQKLRGELLDEDQVYRYRVRNTGQVNQWTAGSITTSCHVDMTYFPFDDQACTIILDSWLYTSDMLNLTRTCPGINLSLYRDGGQWILLDTDMNVVIEEYLETDGHLYIYTVPRFNLYLRRKPKYYVYNVVIPSILLSMLMLLIFLLPADSGEKISLGITILLSFSVFQLVIADSMPKTSDYVPLIARYIIMTMVMTSVSIFCTVGVLTLHHQSLSTPVPNWLQLAVRYLVKPFLRSSQSYKKACKHNGQTTQVPVEDFTEDAHHEDVLTGEDKSQNNYSDWTFIAKVIDILLLIIFLILTTITMILVFVVGLQQRPANLSTNTEA